MSDDERECHDLSNADVVTKYMMAAEICNAALKRVIEQCVPGADISTICEQSDKFIEAECGKVYNKKNKDGNTIQKGIGFPTCISLDQHAGHYSPLPKESKPLPASCIAKIDLGVHIDGYIAMAAHTIYIGEEPCGDRRADAIMAAWTQAEAALRLVKVGNKNTDITNVMMKCAAEFECEPLEGVMSHQMKRHVIDGQNVIISKTIPGEEKIEEFTFDDHEVYAIDCMVSTGTGRTSECETRVTVYKRDVEEKYNLKTAKARQFIAEVSRRFPTLPFNIRSIEDDQVRGLGVSESDRHGLIEPYPVMQEKPGEVIAQFKFTVLLLAGGAKKVAGLPFSQGHIVKSAHEVKDEELKSLLKTSANPKKKKKNAANAAKKEAEAGKAAK